MKIAVDAMGGDYAPKEIVAGVELARDRYPEVEFNLYGQLDKVKPLLQNEERINLIQADEVIAMEDEPFARFGVRNNPASFWQLRMFATVRPMHFSLRGIPVPSWLPVC